MCNRAAGQGARHVQVVNANHIACNRSASKRSVCLAEQYNSLSLERAREMYAANVYGLLVSIISINHLYQGLTALSSTIEQVARAQIPPSRVESGCIIA